MTWFDYFFIIFGGGSVLTVLGFAAATHKFLKTLFVSAVIGIAALLILHFTADFTGFSLEITPYTLGVSGIFGLPGVVCLTLTKMMFGV